VTQDNAAAPPRPEPATVVIFGATGDLTKRKLIPALARMHRAGLLNPESQIVGVARNIAPGAWRELTEQSLAEFAPEVKLTETEWGNLSRRLHMVPGDLKDAATYERLATLLNEPGRHPSALFYLAIPPDWYQATVEGLGNAGLASQERGFRRIVIEKPFGMSYASARRLNQEMQEVFAEDQIYRIDHYLGKESVQNLLVFRFGNSILEPLWNRNYVDHVQISVTETLGIEYRAGYYERAGALRDMIQSHMMQVMTLVAMEPPAEFTADRVRDEKMKVLRAVRRIVPENVDGIARRAQYGAGTIDGVDVPAYCTEEGVAADSATETFAAVRFYIDNWRWQGVPFILWSGKRLQKKASEIVIRFRQPPHNLFDPGGAPPVADALVFRLQPDEGMFLRMNAKRPGLTTAMKRLVLRAPYASPAESLCEAYETLLHDVLIGDATLFSRADEIEEQWEIVEPILDAWQDRLSIARYRAGTWDLSDIDSLFAGCVGGWHKPS
jgi:glucose-6-phosphate 1-dehydrogenase